MFTGLVGDIAVIDRIVPRQGGVRISLRPSRLAVDEVALGESVACSGACLSVAERGDGLLAFEAVPETLSRTTLGGWRAGTRVNLERSLALGERLGGHLVQGHVDAVGEVLRRVPEGQGARLTVSLPREIAALVAEKGSVAVDGVSLTVAALSGEGFEVALIPDTLARTTLGEVTAGSRVNLEADVLARYVARLHAFAGGAPLSPEDLLRWGYGGEAAP